MGPGVPQQKKGPQPIPLVGVRRKAPESGMGKSPKFHADYTFCR